MSTEQANIQSGNPPEEEKTNVVGDKTASASTGSQTANEDVKCLDAEIKVTFELLKHKTDYCNRNSLPLILPS